MLIDDLLKRNAAFVEGRAARPLPRAEQVPLAVVACYDPRLDALLRPALGLAEGEGFMLRTAGAAVPPTSHLLRSLAVAVYLFEVEEVVIVGHSSCRMASFPTDDFISAFRRRGVGRETFGAGDLRRWAGAIATPREGVLATAAAITGAPFLPPDLAIAGAVLDDESGRLEVILRPGEPLPDHLPVPAGGPGDAGGETPTREPAPPAVPPAAPGSPPLPSEALHPAFTALRATVERLTEGGAPDGLDSLRRALAAEGHPLRKLALLRRFVQRTAAESPEIADAFAVLKRQVSGAGHDLAAKTLTDLFGPLLGRKKP
ncbi:MAG: carbonic anhydrase [bacterium]|nr:carbonic anhydrase [bacterium]